MNRIAVYDTIQNGDVGRSALGVGVNDFVFALEESGGNLYAGGRFTQASGFINGYIARYRGSLNSTALPTFNVWGLTIMLLVVAMKMRNQRAG
ncbi:MAG: hypothetical protein AAF446_03185 [Pseudomonadota bacterium]